MTVDEIDFFDPWVAEGDAPRAPKRPPRWRTPASVVPRSRRPSPGDPPSAPLDGQDPVVPAGGTGWATEHFFDAALERVHRIAERLSDVGHEATATHPPEEGPLRLGLRLRPSTGPVAPRAKASSITFEFARDVVVVRRALGRLGEESEDVKRHSYKRVDAAWIVSRTVDFVEEVLRAI